MDKNDLLKEYRLIYSNIILKHKDKNNREKGKLSNTEHNIKRLELDKRLVLKKNNLDGILRNYYCYVISMIETRHKLIEYNDIEFSRRIGEVWEKFCSLILDNPFSKIKRIKEPDTSQFYKKLEKDFNKFENSKELFDIVVSFIGNLDLHLDYFGEKNNIKYGIDFKSGFGSNEKGNTERILQVGKAYNYLNSDIILSVLVRQNENNNYLKRIEKSKIWKVSKGESSYKYLEKLCGSNVTDFLKKELDFQKDFEKDVFKSLGKSVINRDIYLNWYS